MEEEEEEFHELRGLIEDEDSNTKTLAGARILMTRLSAALRVRHLRDPGHPAPEKGAKPLSAADWLDLWRNEAYYEWMDFFSDLDTFHDEARRQYVFFVRVGEVGLANLLGLEGVEFRRFTEK